jgi:hypothetical protein
MTAESDRPIGSDHELEIALSSGYTLRYAQFDMIWNIFLREIARDACLVYEAIMVARDPTHAPYGFYAKELYHSGFFYDGKMPEDIRQVLLAAAVGDWVGMRFVNPIADQPLDI